MGASHIPVCPNDALYPGIPADHHLFLQSFGHPLDHGLELLLVCGADPDSFQQALIELQQGLSQLYQQ